VTVTRAGADDFFNIPNWRPDMYPALPKIVQFGNKDTQVRACGACHLPTGTGHDPVVQKLDNDDMLAIAAYAASLQP
jgi:cytochrome c553